MDHDEHPSQHVGPLRLSASRAGIWFQLIKPGIVFGNAISVMGGFLFGAGGEGFGAVRFFSAVTGTLLIVASGCVFNNCIDRDLDRRMVRTCHRALALRAFPLQLALWYAALLGIVGALVLYIGDGMLTLSLGGIGWIVYVGLYSLWLKRRSHWGIVIGALAGAMPSVIGYCAAQGRFDRTAAALIIAYCLWQMAHSHAIALFRKDDVRAAGLPALAAHRAVRHITGYAFAFALCTVGLGLMAQLNMLYFVIAVGFAGYWWVKGLLHKESESLSDWAHGMFRLSILIIMAFNLAIAVSHMPFVPSGAA